MFQLSDEEFANLRLQISTSILEDTAAVVAVTRRLETAPLFKVIRVGRQDSCSVNCATRHHIVIIDFYCR